ncbi:unnamed protein product [Prorocentrum cordatum]|uniref:Uncharacterized protein n=1 Tax=Prorocentrum cordatum TaxID=2364126 RepID=A0ABN9P8T7_9DINO|nr:unnamed protein product [Polarella glacialis]
MLISSYYRCVATCCARQAAVALILLSVSTTVTTTCALGAARASMDIFEVRERAGYVDVAMLQVSMGDLSYEVQNATRRAEWWPRGWQSSRHQRAVTPVATPSPTTCVDTDNGATNRMGLSCEAYAHDPEEPFSGICFDPYYDDGDFSSHMCCACPQECPPHDQPINAVCEDWIEFRGSNDDGEGRTSHSNLAGLGPDFHRPKELRYYGVGKLANGVSIDIVFVNTSRYTPRNTNWNKISGSQATVNLLIGEYVNIKAEFVRNHTFCPETPHLPKITFCDIDHFKDGENEILILDGVSAVFTVDDDIDFDLDLFEFNTLMSGSPVPLTYTVSSIQTSIPGRTSRKFVSNSGEKFAIRATSRMFGHGCDNPLDQNQLTNITCPDASYPTVDQAKRCFMVEFFNVSEFFVSFKIMTDMPDQYVQSWGRNFAMSGTSSFFADELSQTCYTNAPTTAPTFAPTGTPTAAPTAVPTTSPTVAPTATPTASPTAAPTTAPTALLRPQHQRWHRLVRRQLRRLRHRRPHRLRHRQPLRLRSPQLRRQRHRQRVADSCSNCCADSRAYSGADSCTYCDTNCLSWRRLRCRG